MLGKSADHFMLNQMNERILAVPSNAGGQSMPVPDRERAGTAQVTMKSTIRPGPATRLNSSYVPGAQPLRAPAPVPRATGLFGGLGEVVLSNSFLIMAGLAVGGYFYLKNKKTI